MSMCEVEGETFRKVAAVNHRAWIAQLNNEFRSLLLQQELDLSPCSSKRNSKRIWLSEMHKVPFLERQNGFEKITLKVEV
jgi:hypothetical protein